MVILKWIVKWFLRLGRARWVVDSDGDAGFVVFGLMVVCHKWSDAFLVYTPKDLDDEKLCYRSIRKRELRIDYGIDKDG